MGWSQIVNSDVYVFPSTLPSGVTDATAKSQNNFGWTQSVMGYRSSPNSLTTPALSVNPLIYTQSIFPNYTFEDWEGVVQPQWLQKALGFYYSSPKSFKKDKIYQFNTILINYLQIGGLAGVSNGSPELWRSPVLYMVTPLGDKAEILAEKTFYKDLRQNTDANPNANYDYKKSDTYVFPWPFFESKASLNTLDAVTGPEGIERGRIFTFHYYSSPNEDKISHYSQNPTIYYSNNLFGNSQDDTTYASIITPGNPRRNALFKGNRKSQSTGEGIVSHSVNETDWLVQGFSYVSLFTKDTTTNNPIFTASPWNLGGNLFGNGWYVLKNLYIWYDKPESTVPVWQTSYKYIANEPFRNMPVGGPWSNGPFIDIPNYVDWYGWNEANDFYAPDTIGGRERVNTGSALWGYSKSPHPGFRKNNYIARYINQDKFNLSFRYQNDRGDNTGLKFYLSNNLPSQRPVNSLTYPTLNPDKAILDWGSVTDTITVSTDANNYLTSANTLKEIRVKIDLQHTWDGDLIINLRGPRSVDSQGLGKVINLFNREKGNSDNFTGTVFTSDDSKNSIYYGTPPFTDTFKMKKDVGAGYGAYRSNTKDIRKLLNTSNTIAGNWTLYIKDDAGLDSGLLVNWTIEFIFDDSSNINYLGVLTQSTATQSYNFYGLQGNQYIIFTADAVTSGYTTVKLENLLIEDSYHPQNNTLISVGTYSYEFYQNQNQNLFFPSGLTSSYSYSANYGSGNTLNATQSLTFSTIRTKAGTGRFTSGIWEDGNWINGWRKDNNMYKFFDINQFFSYNRDKKWRFSIIGSSYNVSSFNIGDKISISNIVAIDINENRKLIKNYFTVISKTANTLVVEFEYDFPLRRLERDSKYHFIYVTKNIWLNGNFFNGYFGGIWTNGLFNGYPFITEMYDSHWIDGTFTGGHFKSEVISLTYSSSNVKATNKFININFDKIHSFNVNDYIYVNEFLDDSNSVIFGESKVNRVISETEIETSILTNRRIIDYLLDTNNERLVDNFIGVVKTSKNTGLIQNVQFDSLNASKATSVSNMDDRSVFSYNSWIDVVYDNTSATNIFKPQQGRTSLLSSNFSSSSNNLYGYITNDILSSNSRFRDSFSNSIRSYKLGTKYTIFHDYIGDSGYFNEYFDPNSQDFKDLGWKYSLSSTAGSFLTFSRITDISPQFLFNLPKITGKELKVSARYDGGVLNLDNPVDEIANRDVDKIRPERYTMVEFDLVDSDIVEDYYVGRSLNYNPFPMELPQLHFGNLNIVNKSLIYPTLNLYVTNITEATYLPVYKNVNHIFTPNKKKFEYFYNKRDLMMTFRGSGADGKEISDYIIDNLKLYEVDMIPFFKYFTYENINRTVQIPIEAKRPYIKYQEYFYKFISLTPKPGGLSDYRNESFTSDIAANPVNSIFNRSDDRSS